MQCKSETEAPPPVETAGVQGAGGGQGSSRGRRTFLSRDRRDAATPPRVQDGQQTTADDCRRRSTAGCWIVSSTHTLTLSVRQPPDCVGLDQGGATQAGSGAEERDCRTSDENPPPPPPVPPPPTPPPPHPSSAVQASASHMFSNLYNLLLIGWLTSDL